MATHCCAVSLAFQVTFGRLMPSRVQASNDGNHTFENPDSIDLATMASCAAKVRIPTNRTFVGTFARCPPRARIETSKISRGAKATAHRPPFMGHRKRALGC